jgi:hypothetical protein
MLKTLAAAVLLSATTLAFAQQPPEQKAPPQKGHRFDCSQAKDPKACTERREKLKAARDKARSACEGKQGTDHAACMEQQYCAQAKDPASCEARIKSRVEKRRERREQQEKK